ncbi:NAD(P)-binding protein [Cadophora sp. DSE1049]|nr:NAD(P)-binding protein [Cadophora sp. DSE1049]
MPSQSVLLIGASGWVGPYFSAEFLAQKDKFARIAILSDASKVSKFEKEAAAGTEIVVGSYLEPESFKGFTTVLSILGNFPMKLQPQIIDAAIAAGVTHFYPSEFGSDLSQPIALKQRYFRDKQTTRRHLEKVAKEHDTFGYTFVMNGGFAEFAAHPAFGFVKEERKLEFWGRTDRVQPFAGVKDVAKYVVATVLTIPQPGTVQTSQERQFKIPTTAYTWDEIVAIISRLEGVEYQIVRHPNEEAYAQMAKHAKEGNVEEELAWALKAFLGDPNADPVPKPWNNDKFPDIVPEDLEVSLKRYLDATQ